MQMSRLTAGLMELNLRLLDREHTSGEAIRRAKRLEEALELETAGRAKGGAG